MLTPRAPRSARVLLVEPDAVGRAQARVPENRWRRAPRSGRGRGAARKSMHLPLGLGQVKVHDGVVLLGQPVGLGQGFQAHGVGGVRPHRGDDPGETAQPRSARLRSRRAGPAGGLRSKMSKKTREMMARMPISSAAAAADSGWKYMSWKVVVPERQHLQAGQPGAGAHVARPAGAARAARSSAPATASGACRRCSRGTAPWRRGCGR